MVARGRSLGVEELGEGGKKVQTSSDMINNLWGFNVQLGGYSSRYCIIYLKVAKSVDLKCFHHKNEMVIVLSDECIDEPYGDSFFYNI